MTKAEILAKMGDERERVERALEMMKPKTPEYRIAIMTCRQSQNGCTGRSCFWAFETKKRSFEAYRNSEIPVCLSAFFPCNGCDADYANDPGMQKKLERLILEDVRCIHLSDCMKKRCKNIDQIRNLIEQYGFICITGTH